MSELYFSEVGMLCNNVHHVIDYVRLPRRIWNTLYYFVQGEVHVVPKIMELLYGIKNKAPVARQRDFQTIINNFKRFTDTLPVIVAKSGLGLIEGLYYMACDYFGIQEGHYVSLEVLYLIKYISDAGVSNRDVYEYLSMIFQFILHSGLFREDYSIGESDHPWYKTYGPRHIDIQLTTWLENVYWVNNQITFPNIRTVKYVYANAYRLWNGSTTLMRGGSYRMVYPTIYENDCVRNNSQSGFDVNYMFPCFVVNERNDVLSKVNYPVTPIRDVPTPNYISKYDRIQVQEGGLLTF